MVVTAIGGAAAPNFGNPLENVLSLLVGTLTTLCCIKDSAKNVAGDQGPPRLLFLLLFDSPFDDELRGRNMFTFRAGSNMSTARTCMCILGVSGFYEPDIGVAIKDRP